MMDAVTREAATRATATRAATGRSYGSPAPTYPPPKRRRPLRTFLVVASSVLVGVAVVVLAVGLDELDQRKPRIEIPEGVPPGPGAPTPPIDINGPVGLRPDWGSGGTPVGRAGNLAYRARGLRVRGRSDGRDQARLWNRMDDTRGDCGRREQARHVSRLERRRRRAGEPADSRYPARRLAGVAEIPDTDGGAMDGDATHDRAMGPLQFIRRRGRAGASTPTVTVWSTPTTSTTQPSPQRVTCVRAVATSPLRTGGPPPSWPTTCRGSICATSATARLRTRWECGGDLRDGRAGGGSRLLPLGSDLAICIRRLSVVACP